MDTYKIRKELKIQIIQQEDLYDLFIRQQIPASPINYLIEKIRKLKIELAELEARARIEEQRLISMN